jgi:hypothetical protein
MSPDGRKIAYVDYAPSGTLAVWVRSIDSRDARVLPGSENVFEKAATPFWSPDSRMIAYAGLDGNILKLKKISVTGGTPEVIAEIGPRNVNGNGMRRGHWFSDDLILFANDVVYRVSSKGGEVKRVTTADPAENGHTSPWLLPDGRHFLYKGSSSTVDNRAIYVASLDFSLRKRLISPAYSGGKFADGYMLFQRSGTLFAQKFDLDALALAGEAIQIADGLVYAAGPGIGSFEVSTEGTLIYRPTSANPTREQSARETTPNAIPGAIRVIRNWTSLLKK